MWSSIFFSFDINAFIDGIITSTPLFCNSKLSYDTMHDLEYPLLVTDQMSTGVLPYQLVIFSSVFIPLRANNCCVPFCKSHMQLVEAYALVQLFPLFLLFHPLSFTHSPLDCFPRRKSRFRSCLSLFLVTAVASLSSNQSPVRLTNTD